MVAKDRIYKKDRTDVPKSTVIATKRLEGTESVVACDIFVLLYRGTTQIILVFFLCYYYFVLKLFSTLKNR